MKNDLVPTDNLISLCFRNVWLKTLHLLFARAAGRLQPKKEDWLHCDARASTDTSVMRRDTLKWIFCELALVIPVWQWMPRHNHYSEFPIAMSNPVLRNVNRLMTKPTKYSPSLISLCCALNGLLRTQAFFMRTANTLIRLGGCPGWSEYSLGAQSCCWFWHEAARTLLKEENGCI